jgi:Domain of unknown function (DUF4352)
LSAFLTVVVSLVGILIVLGIIGAIAGDPESASSPQATAAPTSAESEPETTAEPPATEPQTDVGNPVRDGDFEFVVSQFGCRAGECKATMTVENIGNQPGTMFASNQYLYDDQGRQFAADDSLTDSLFFEELNPGQRVRGIIVWRLAAGRKPTI